MVNGVVQSPDVKVSPFRLQHVETIDLISASHEVNYAKVYPPLPL